MLHILWLILRFILILVGIALGLLLLLLFLLLFCPVCYRASASKEADTSLKDARVQAGVSWLFHGISLKITLDHGSLEKSVGIFGIPVDKIWSRRSGRKKSGDKSVKEELVSVNEETSEMDVPEAKTATQDKGTVVKEEPERVSDTADPVEIGESESSEKTEGLLKPEEPEKEVKGDLSEGNEQEESNLTEASEKDSAFITEKTEVPSRGFLKVLGQVLKGNAALPIRIVRKIHNIYCSFRDKLRRIKNAVSNLNNKKEWWKKFLTNEKTKEALSLVWSDGKALLRHIFPRKLAGEVRFDSEDPAITGTVLAVLGMTIPLHKNCIQVTPLFENENYLAGNVWLKGRFYGIVVIKTALEIYFNKNVKYVIRRWRHTEVS